MSLGWGGGQALVQKRGQVSDRGIDKIFAGWGDPSPPGKKTLTPFLFFTFCSQVMTPIFKMISHLMTPF